MFIHGGFICNIAQSWRQSTCPSTGELIIYTMKYLLLSNKKKLTIDIYIHGRTNLKIIMLSEVEPKSTVCFLLYKILENAK